MAEWRPSAAIEVEMEFDSTFSVRLVGGPYDGQTVTGEFIGHTVRCSGSEGDADYRIDFSDLARPVANFVERKEPETSSGSRTTR